MKKTVTLLLAIFAAMILTGCQLPMSDVCLKVDTDATLKEVLIVKKGQKYEEYKALSVEKGGVFHFSVQEGSYDIYANIDFDPETSIYETPNFYPLSPRKTYLKYDVTVKHGQSVEIKLSDFG